MKIGQLFGLGIWAVKADEISEFIAAWQTSSEWIARNLTAGGEGVLLQDAANPARFVPFASALDMEKAEGVMSRPEFQGLWSRVLEHIQDVQPSRMRLAGHYSSGVSRQ